MEDELFFSFVSFSCALVFILIGLSAMTKKVPMHFWTFSNVPAAQISDIRAYNRENAIMWITYGSLSLLMALSVYFMVSTLHL